MYKATRKSESSFSYSFLTVFPSLVMQWISLNRFVFFFNAYVVLVFFNRVPSMQISDLIPGGNISGGKVSVAGIDGGGVLGCSEGFGGVLYTSIHVIILIRRNLFFYSQTNEFSVKMILVLRFSPWFLYIWIEQKVDHFDIYYW